MNDAEQDEALRQLTETLGHWWPVVDKNIKTLYRKADAQARANNELRKIVQTQGILLWFLLGSVIIGLLAFVAFLLTR